MFRKKLRITEIEKSVGADLCNSDSGVPGTQRRDISVGLTNLEKHYNMLDPGGSDTQRRRTEFQAKALKIIYLLNLETKHKTDTLCFLYRSINK